MIFTVLNLHAEIIYLEPVRNAEYVSINNNIIIGFDEPLLSADLNSALTVKGSKSGMIRGKVILTSDRMKLLFYPDRAFAFNETVEVKLNQVRTYSQTDNSVRYSFRTEVRKIVPDYDRILSNEIGIPPYNFQPEKSKLFSVPELQVLVSNNPSPGNLYLASFPFTVNPTEWYLLIADNTGAYSYTRPVPDRPLDYKKQPNGLLTYFTNGKYYAEDYQHNLIDSFECGNGYTTDNHEIKILNSGHVLLMSYDPQQIDMSQIVQGGDTNATVYGLIIQELDANKNVVFQWRSWDHIAITDAIHENLTAPIVDYVHGNAIEPDRDGNIMISSRHLSEITKISRATGNIIWRLGGVQNQFTFINDTLKFSYQHDIRRIANGNITLFDNGNFHSPQFSRAVEYKLDEVNKTATLVWQFRHNPDYYTFAMGSAQRLQNGNTLIGWGSISPTLTEVKPNGNIALEMRLPYPTVSYRVFRDETKLTLNVKMAMEGLYNISADKLNRKDTVRVYLRNVNSPYQIVDSAKSVVDSLNFNGNYIFYKVSAGTYYITAKHSGSIETWSKTGGETFLASSVHSYDFTNSGANAYGNNVILCGSKYCFYGGDVNQDGTIDLTDGSLIDNDVFNYRTGNIQTDLNGDGIVDVVDAFIANNNIFRSIVSRTP